LCCDGKIILILVHLLFTNTAFNLKYLILIVLFFLCSNVCGQDITFKNISTVQGLSSNLVYNACQGPDGLLWILANNRLNSYNEGQATTYTNDLISNIEDYNISEILIDESNIIWLKTAEGQLLYLDRNRVLNCVDQPHSLPTGILNFLKAETGRVEIMAREGHFYFDVKSQTLDTIHLFEKPLYTHRPIQISNEGHGKYLISAVGKVIFYDGNEGRSTYVFDDFRTIGAAMINNRQMVVSTANHHELFLIDIVENKIIKNLALDIVRQFPQTNTYYRRIKHIDADHIAITSGHQGLFIMNRHDLSVKNYAHDFANPSSISSDNSYYLYADKKGSVFVTSRTSGLNIFNLNRNNAKHIKSFVDYNLSEIFEGHISHVRRDQSGNFWLSSSQGLLKYDITNNASVIKVRKEENDTRLSITSLSIDSYERIWLGVSGGGVEVVDKYGTKIKSFVYSADDSKSLKNNFIHSMALGIDDKLWIGSSGGINRVDLHSLELETSSNQDSLQIKNAQIKEIKTIGKETFVGTWRKVGYVFSEKGLQKIGISEKFEIKEITAFGKDEEGRLYMGSQNGLFISSIGEDSKYEIESKLLEGRILSIDKDNSGSMWIATENILYNYDPKTQRIEEFGHEHGFTGGGFRMHASFKDKDGRLYYGMNTGMCFFDPVEVSKNEVELNPYITGIIENNNKKLISGDEQIHLPSQENNIGVYYQNIDIWNTHSVQYQYSVSNGNEEWIPAITNPILIQNIKSGSYKVRLRASLDGEKWVTSANEIDLQIAYQWWRSWWFYGIALLLSAVVLYFAFRFFLRLKAEKQEEMKYDESLKFFSFSMHKYADIDNEFWDVILECIRQLDIDASAIYLLDKEKTHLLRQAVKVNSEKHEDYLKHQVFIPIGEGVIGSAAQERKSSVISDLSLEKTEFEHKSIRQSKICVPILSSDEILGVIDCEHRSKDYFNERRLSFISAIATIVATKIEAYNAEQERKEAEISLSNNLKKVSQLEMKSLRSQMNPHFMFNSLNSINNFIVKNDQENASDYLTNFAQLMRIILENSRQDWVSLESELKALRLYIDMEKLRFENLFYYHESISDKINLMTTLIPPMLIQPYIENAIWHGLLPKTSDQCNLKLSLDLKGEYLHITIDDDGIGAKVSKRNKSNFNISKKSFGMKIIAERLDIINEIYNLDANVQMFDKSDISDSETGTKVILSMKIKMTEK
jgi:ligand-binding sensor domain-containing protein